MKFNLTINDIETTELDKIINALNVINTPATLTCLPVSETDNTDGVLTDVESDDDTINFDKDGLPWDARIHSSNHQITAKGVWQRRRGVTDEEYNRVKNELLGIQEPELPVIEQPVIAPQPIPLSPELAAVNHTLYTSAEDLARVQPVMSASTPAVPTYVEPIEPVAPTPVIDNAVLYQTMFDKIKNGMASGVVKANDIQNLVAAINAQFGTAYQTLALIKDDTSALQFAINDLTTRGL